MAITNARAARADMVALKDIKVTWTDYFYVTLMLITSWSIFYEARFGARITFPILFILSFGLFLKKGCKIRSDWAFKYIVVLSIAIVLNKFVFNPNTTDNYWIAMFVGAWASYFFCSAFNFQVFRKAYIDVIAVISLLSMIVFFIDQSPLRGRFESILLTDGGVERMSFYIFHVGWGYDGSFADRMAGLWHEPGACQIFLNLGLLFSIPLVRNKLVTKFDMLKIAIIVCGVLCTQSTGGYLALLVIAYFMASSILRKVPVLIQMIIGALLVLAIINTSVVQDKMAQDTGMKANTSKAVRIRDNIACLTMAIDRPLTGYGFNSKQFMSESRALDNATSSNGILRVAACIGIWWIFIYIPVIYFGLKKMKLGIPIWASMAVVLMLESNEAYIQWPISYMFILSYGSYNGALALKKNIKQQRQINLRTVYQ